MALKLLFNACVIHEYVPVRFARGFVFRSLKKYNLNINVASNYRAITITPIIDKLFESCLYPVLTFMNHVCILFNIHTSIDKITGKNNLPVILSILV